MNTLHNRATLALLVAALSGALGVLGILQWPLPQVLDWLRRERIVDLAWWSPPGWVAIGLTMIVLLPLLYATAAALTGPLRRLLRALEGAVMHYRDGDFSMSIAAQGNDELGALVRQHNDLGHALRDQRQRLVERELLLDTIVQQTPLALLLTLSAHDGRERIVLANIAARQLLAEGRSLQDADFGSLVAHAPEAFQRALRAGEDALFSVLQDGAEESFHLSRRALRLQGRPHTLYVLRRMTRELSRQEMAVWKRVIRVMSHELNNSLAPISSMAHSGAELARRGDHERLPRVFATIGERAEHLREFLSGYAQVAKLPMPRPAAVDWAGFVDTLGEHSRFRLEGELPEAPGWFDAAQVEQALINLLKNAHEAQGDGDAVTLEVTSLPGGHRIVVGDRGSGMSEAVLAQALLPFYSTKREGSGLGLALAREIAEAHGGRIGLANREGGGLRVTLWLPAADGVNPPAHRPHERAGRRRREPGDAGRDAG